MKHKHHILPRHAGGTDDPSNIIELSVEEHAEAHKKLYELYGKKEDLCAYYMLSGKNNCEEFVKLRAQIGGKAAQKERIKKGLIGKELFYGRFFSNQEDFFNCSRGGSVQGPKNAKSGHMKNIQKQGASLGGKKSVEVCRERQKNAFFDPILRTEIAKLGGHVQGKKNAESGHLKRIAQLPSKRNKGMIWITDGNSNKMINNGENIDDGWRKGKTQKRKVY